MSSVNELPSVSGKRRLPLREQRLRAITGYDGTAADLVARGRENKLSNRSRSFTQCGTCSSFSATLILSLIHDAAVVNHAPAGCAGDFGLFNLYNRYGQTKRGLALSNAHLVSTNLSDNDAVFGATEKLRDALREAKRRFEARAIFVTSSCVSGIVGEDIETVVQEATHELGIPVLSVACEGVCSELWANGWDAAFDAILRGIVKPARSRRADLVNVINFIGEDYFADLLRPLGLVSNLVVPFATVEQLQRLSESVATVQMCPTLGTHLGAGLEQQFGVPEIRHPPPYGLAATDAWLRELATITHRQALVEQVIGTERESIQDDLASLRKLFCGARAFVAAGPAHGHGFMAVLRDLGMQLVGACGWHHDTVCDHGDPSGDTLNQYVRNHGDVPYGVCHKQPFELTNVLRRVAPDVLVVRHPSLAICGAKLGIPTFFVDDEHLAIGYRGLIRYGNKIADWFKNPALERNLAKHTRLPYSNWWLSQPAHSFLSTET